MRKGRKASAPSNTAARLRPTGRLAAALVGGLLLLMSYGAGGAAAATTDLMAGVAGEWGGAAWSPDSNDVAFVVSRDMGVGPGGKEHVFVHELMARRTDGA